MQAYRLEQRLASFYTTPEQDAYLLAKTGPAALSAIPRQIVTFRMLRKHALQVRAHAKVLRQSVCLHECPHPSRHCLVLCASCDAEAS